MREKAVLSEARYGKLLKDVRGIIEEGKARVARAANQELITAYWGVGRRITSEGLTANSGYGDSVMSSLSEDLGIDRNTLYQAVSFFKQNKVCPRAENLTWSHYRVLLGVSDSKERQWYVKRASRENLKRDQLLRAVQKDLYHEEAEEGSRFRPSARLKRPSEPTYVYKAIVERVIDGDTLLLRIDLGFQVWKEQRVRLAEIDAPAMDEPKGRDACKYVLNQLSKVDFVMVKTNKIDVYGRYVGHIFYSFKNLGKSEIFSKGRYLNQELVQKKLARVF